MATDGTADAAEPTAGGDARAPDRVGGRAPATIWALTLAAGATDALGFMALGNVFASVMTGNMVLFGVSVGRHDGALALHAGVAFAGYAVGTFAGSWLARTAPRRGLPGGRVAGLVAELGLLVALLIGWELTSGRPAGGSQLVLLSVAAAAMGVQSGAVHIRTPTGTSTTYLTGTLTGLLGALAGGAGTGEHHRGAGSLLALVAGAVAGAVLVVEVRPVAAALPVAALALALLVDVG